MNITITLLAYWSIAMVLALGGIYALRQGFKLIREGQGKTQEESSIKFWRFSVTVGSLGSLVMVTAFLWGYAATLALPDYEDSDVSVKVARLEQSLEEAEEKLASRDRAISAARDQDEVMEINKNLEKQRAIFSNLEQLIKEGNQDQALNNIDLLREINNSLQIRYLNPE